MKAHLVKNLSRAAIICQTGARRNARVGGKSGFKTSHGSYGLVGSIGWEVNESALIARVGSNLKYARIQEVGGTIRAKDKLLSIPLSKEAQKSGGARTMAGLILIPKGKGRQHSLLVRPGTKGGFELHWVLVPSVTLPPRPYLRPALYDNRGPITAALLRPMPTTRTGT